MAEEVTAGLLALPGKPVKLHHLVKAPENAIDSIRIRESWNADEPATVYTTPERMPDGTPCTAATVILRTRGCQWWWKSGCTFCGYFNDVRDDVTSLNLHAQWLAAKNQLNDFEGCDMIKVYTMSPLLLEIITETKRAFLMPPLPIFRTGRDNP